MVTPVEARAAGARGPQCQWGDGNPTDPMVLVATLVAALEQALLAARCLLVALEAAGKHHEAWANTARASPATSGMARGACDTRAACPVLASPAGLSRREAEVLALLATGRSNRDIARVLFLSPRTVQRHVANLYPKIGAHTKAEATAYALRLGLA
jgi:DNA-binding NarL/FixJ family response regulator